MPRSICPPDFRFAPLNPFFNHYTPLFNGQYRKRAHSSQAVFSIFPKVCFYLDKILFVNELCTLKSREQKHFAMGKYTLIRSRFTQH
jgi:hypothetical protein